MLKWCTLNDRIICMIFKEHFHVHLKLHLTQCEIPCILLWTHEQRWFCGRWETTNLSRKNDEWHTHAPIRRSQRTIHLSFQIIVFTFFIIISCTLKEYCFSFFFICSCILRFENFAHGTIERFDGFFMNEFSEWMDIGQWRLLLQDLIWRLKKLDKEKFQNEKNVINKK